MKKFSVLLLTAVLTLTAFTEANAFKVFGTTIKEKIKDHGDLQKSYLVEGSVNIDWPSVINCDIVITSEDGATYHILSPDALQIVPGSGNTFGITITLPDGTQLYVGNFSQEQEP